MGEDTCRKYQVAAGIGLPKIIHVQKNSGGVVFAEVTEDRTKDTLVNSVNRIVSRLAADKEE